MEKILNKIDAKFAQIDAKFDKIDAKFEQMDGKFEIVEIKSLPSNGMLGGREF